MVGINVIKICQAHIAVRVLLETLPTSGKINNIVNNNDNKNNNSSNNDNNKKR